MFSQKDFDDAGLGPSEPAQPVIKVSSAVDMDPVRTFDRAAKAYRDRNPMAETGLEDTPGDSPTQMRKAAAPEPKFRTGQSVRHNTSGVEGTVVECGPGFAVVESSPGVHIRYPCASLSTAEAALDAPPHFSDDKELNGKAVKLWKMLANLYENGTSVHLVTAQRLLKGVKTLDDGIEALQRITV